MQYNIGDIVFASEAMENERKEEVKNHLYVIISDDGKVVPADYFGFIVSSQMNKSNASSSFKYNEPIVKNNINHLKCDSIVKCDQVWSIPTSQINRKIGTVEEEHMERFLDAYSAYLEENT